MIVLVPTGVEEPLRAAKLTLALIALNVAVFLVLPGGAQELSEKEAELERIAEWSLRPSRRQNAALDERAGRFPTTLAFLHQDHQWPSEIEPGEEKERLEASLEDYRALRASHSFYRFGFVPSEIGPLRLLAHQFLHADAFHLFFNMLFLWAVGALVELTLGAPLFLAGYLASGAAAALAHAAFNLASSEPAIGASGAVAGVMGMLAVLHGGTRLQLVLVAMVALAPRILFFSLPAWVFIGLWVLEQVFFASFGSTVLGVAFAAHLGGFAFGALAALGFRWVRGVGTTW